MDNKELAGFFGPDLHNTEVMRIGIFDPSAVERIIHVVESTLINNDREYF